jgi:hypothetical protein
LGLGLIKGVGLFLKKSLTISDPNQIRIVLMHTTVFANAIE